MQHNEAASTLDRLIPEIQRTGDPEGTLLKYAKDKKLASAQLDKLGQLFNVAKTLTFMDKRANRGGTFKLLNVEKMVEKYNEFEPKKAHMQRAYVKSASSESVESHDPYNFPHFYKAATEGREEFIDTTKEAIHDPRAEIKQAFDAQVKKMEDRVHRGMVDEFVFDNEENARQLVAKVARTCRVGVNLNVAITDAIGLYGDTVRPACEFLKKEATSHGVTPSIPEELPRSLYQDSTGEAGNICKIAEYLELARGGIEYREKFSAIGTTSAPGTQSTPGSSTSYKGQFKSPKPSQSGGGFSGGSGGGSGSDSSGKGSSGVGTSAKDILTAPIQAMNILPHQKPVVENRRQKNIDESSSDTEFLATLQQLVIDDPVISDASDKAITNAANSVRSAAPEIAGNPAEFRWVLREILQYDSEDGNVPAHIIKDLQERTSNSLKNRKSQREEAADRYGAKA